MKVSKKARQMREASAALMLLQQHVFDLGLTKTGGILGKALNIMGWEIVGHLGNSPEAKAQLLADAALALKNNMPSLARNYRRQAAKLGLPSKEKDER